MNGPVCVKAIYFYRIVTLTHAWLLVLVFILRVTVDTRYERRGIFYVFFNQVDSATGSRMYGEFQGLSSLLQFQCFVKKTSAGRQLPHIHCNSLKSRIRML